MGSAVAAHVAKRGMRVVGLDRYELGHDLGASAGRSRVIRKAYFESPQYVPLLERAYELWRELERETETRLLDLTGILMVGASDGSLMRGVRASVERYGVAVEELARATVAARYPQTSLFSNESALFEPEAGMVFPELGIAAHQTVARKHGADLRGNVEVVGWRRSMHGTIEIELRDQTTLHADRLVLCAGPWTAKLARDLALPIVIQRNVQIWFEPQTRSFERGTLPVFFLQRDGLPNALYGFPDYGDGVKAALHGFGVHTSPETLDREIASNDIAAVRSALDAFLPGAAGTFRAGKVCMYALTPDEHSIIDRHPHDDGIVIAAGFSGHGYKFCPVVGELAADLIEGKRPPHIAFLSLDRFAREARP
jgi:sarcosine oxidase